MAEVKASDVRELLKVTEQPEVISLAGGLPAPDLTAKLFLDEGSLVLCESPTYLAALQSFQVFAVLGPRREAVEPNSSAAARGCQARREDQYRMLDALHNEGLAT